MTALDPRFAKIIALMNSTQHDGERVAAHVRAAAVAASCGMTFDQAMAEMNRVKRAPFVNVMSSFEDFMERQEPGWRVRNAAEKAEKERLRLARLKDILERYGSKDAALAPCAREQKLRAALKRWIKYCKPPHQRWTYDIDGKGSSYPGDHSDEIIAATKNAYPMPTTFAEAKAEYDYWDARRSEIEDVLGPGQFGDTGLDRPADLRFELVRRLYEKDLPVFNLTDLLARFVLYRSWENHSTDIEDALIRDLEVIVQNERDLSNLSKAFPPDRGRSNETGAEPTNSDRFGKSRNDADLSNPSTAAKGGHNVPTPSDHLSASDHRHTVADMLRADPGCSDRHIARACGCSPTTVGKLRRGLGLSETPRSVQRRGQTYKMRAYQREDATTRAE